MFILLAVYFKNREDKQKKRALELKARKERLRIIKKKKWAEEVASQKCPDEKSETPSIRVDDISLGKEATQNLKDMLNSDYDGEIEVEINLVTGENGDLEFSHVNVIKSDDDSADKKQTG